MAKKTKKAEKSAAIVKALPAASLAERVKGQLGSAFAGLAEMLSAEVVPAPVLAGVMYVLRDAKKVEGSLEELAKGRIVSLLKEQGTVKSDKGARELAVNGWKLSMKPYRTGIDPKKLEALLRAKKLEPASFMDTAITYSVNEQKLGVLVAHKHLTSDELETCNYTESWTVDTPNKED